MDGTCCTHCVPTRHRPDRLSAVVVLLGGWVSWYNQGSVLFLGDPDGLPDVPRPDPPRGYSAGRMDIRDFRFK